MVEKRKAERKIIEAQRAADPGYRTGEQRDGPREKFTPNLEKYLKEGSEYSWMYETNASFSRAEQDKAKDVRRHRVKQYAPVWIDCVDDYGCEWEWYHGRTSLRDDCED